jgi:hypothetical protein
MSHRIEFHDRYAAEALTGCWLWTHSFSEDGYGKMPRKVEGERAAHRISWRLARGAIPEGLHVLHKCDNRACVNPDHLYLGTNTENIGDMIRRKRHRTVLSPEETLRGEVNPMAKLTDAQVVEIRALAGVMRQRDIATKFGICEDYVSQLMRRDRRRRPANGKKDWNG